MDDNTKLALRMEDNIEERIEIDKEAISGTNKSLGDIIEGECRSCGRLYPKAHLQPINSEDYKALFTDDPSGYCIPCWRKKNDLPKLDRDGET